MFFSVAAYVYRLLRSQQITPKPEVSDAFDRALEFTLRWEGGYVNHPNDPGGATNKGVTQAVYNAWRRAKGLAIRGVARIQNVEVEEIYRKRYWQKGHCDELPERLAIAHFDWCVNTGVRRATRHLQEVINATPDGVWGPKTRNAVMGALEAVGEENVLVLYLNRRKRYYMALGSKPRFRVFVEGWMNRWSALWEYLK